MKLKRFSIGTLGLLAVSGLAWSCSSKSDDCNANLNCAPYEGEAGTSGSSSASGASGKGGAASGSGGASGTRWRLRHERRRRHGSRRGQRRRAAPRVRWLPGPRRRRLRDLGRIRRVRDAHGRRRERGRDASASVRDGHERAGEYWEDQARVRLRRGVHGEPETLEIPDRVSIYGGFTCDGGTWKYDSSFPAHLLPASPIGATITDAKVGVLIQDLRIDAGALPVGTVGGSSFGLIVKESQGVVLRRTEIRAGKATAGKDGAAGQAAADGLAPAVEQNGSDACSATPKGGDGSTQSTCGSKGGNGGLGYATLNAGTRATGNPEQQNLIAAWQRQRRRWRNASRVFAGTSGERRASRKSRVTIGAAAAGDRHVLRRLVTWWPAVARDERLSRSGRRWRRSEQGQRDHAWVQAAARAGWGAAAEKQDSAALGAAHRLPC